MAQLSDYNCYAYVAANPLIATDPSGALRFTPSSAAAGCHGSPKGKVVFIPDRGRFVPGGCFVKALDPELLPNDIGTSVTLTWGGTKFTDAAGCCCCDEIGFIQVHMFKRVTTNALLDALRGSKSWEVDKNIPYPHGTTVNPCTDAAAQIRMTDEPGVVHKGLWGHVISLEQHFITCVVCLKGNEGIPGGALALTVEGVTVYGCTTWGHKIVRSGSVPAADHRTGYLYTRYFAGNKEWGKGYADPPKELDPYKGALPNEMPYEPWVEAVDKWKMPASLA